MEHSNRHQACSQPSEASSLLFDSAGNGGVTEAGGLTSTWHSETGHTWEAACILVLGWLCSWLNHSRTLSALGSAISSECEDNNHYSDL